MTVWSAQAWGCQERLIWKQGRRRVKTLVVSLSHASHEHLKSVLVHSLHFDNSRHDSKRRGTTLRLKPWMDRWADETPVGPSNQAVNQVGYFASCCDANHFVPIELCFLQNYHYLIFQFNLNWFTREKDWLAPFVNSLFVFFLPANTNKRETRVVFTSTIHF